MKKETEDLVKELYKLGYTNVDVFTKEGKISAKDIVNKQDSTQTNKHQRKKKGRKK